jgi:RNA polymerase sigma-70 factor (ECF subfamily)
VNFDALWDEAVPCLKVLASARIYNADDREDVLQVTRIKAWTNFHTFNPEMSFRNWVLRIFERSYVDHLRWTGRRIQALSLEGLMDEFPDLELAASKSETHETTALKMVFEELPEGVKALVIAQADGKTYEQYSAQTGIPRGTLSSWRYRARRAFEGAA